MPAGEFDAYLRALGSLLRLRPAQRAELADEFRDHLETRLEELTAAGVPRAAAVEAALEEFGDAAGLASHFTVQFTALARRRRVHFARRVLMRVSLTAATLAAVVGLGWLLAPPNPVFAPPGPVAAQDGGSEPADEFSRAPAPPAVAADPPDPAPADDADPDAAAAEKVWAALNKPVSLEGIRPGDDLATAVDAVATQAGVPILPDRRALSLEGIELGDVLLENPPELEGLTLRRSLAVLLENVEPPLVAAPRDGLLYVTTAAEAARYLDTRIYNVRDLLADVRPAGPPERAADELLNVVTSVTGGADNGGDWQRIGAGPGPGTIEDFDGLLAVRQTAAVHRQIEELLAALRETGAERGWAGEKPGGKAGAAAGGGTGGSVPVVIEMRRDGPADIQGITPEEMTAPDGLRGREVVIRAGEGISEGDARQFAQYMRDRGAASARVETE